jgi:hypothetical protein
VSVGSRRKRHAGATRLREAFSPCHLPTFAPSAAYENNVYDGHAIGTNLVTRGQFGSYNSTAGVAMNSGNPIQSTLVYDDPISSRRWWI